MTWYLLDREKWRDSVFLITVENWTVSTGKTRISLALTVLFFHVALISFSCSMQSRFPQTQTHSRIRLPWGFRRLSQKRLKTNGMKVIRMQPRPPSIAVNCRLHSEGFHVSSSFGGTSVEQHENQIQMNLVYLIENINLYWNINES